MRNRIILLIASIFLFGFWSCKTETKEDIKPDIPLPLVTIEQPDKDTTIFVGTSLSFKGKIVGDYTSFEWSVNGTTDASLALTFSKVFSEVGTFEYKFSAVNEGGTSTKSRIVKVVEIPPTRTELLAGSVSKKWKYTSIKLNDQELIKEYEKDNILEFFISMQDPTSDTPYRYIRHNGTINVDADGNAEFEYKGNWEFKYSETRIKMEPIFSREAFIESISETELVLSITYSADSKLYYSFVAVN